MGNRFVRSEEVKSQIVTLPAWEGGPLRQFAETRVATAFVAYGERGCRYAFAGRYICSDCQEPVNGVYSPKWVCAACLNPRKAGKNA